MLRLLNHLFKVRRVDIIGCKISEKEGEFEIFGHVTCRLRKNRVLVEKEHDTRGDLQKSIKSIPYPFIVQLEGRHVLHRRHEFIDGRLEIDGYEVTHQESENFEVIFPEWVRNEVNSKVLYDNNFLGFGFGLCGLQNLLASSNTEEAGHYLNKLTPTYGGYKNSLSLVLRGANVLHKGARYSLEAEGYFYKSISSFVMRRVLPFILFILVINAYFYEAEYAKSQSLELRMLDENFVAWRLGSLDSNPFHSRIQSEFPSRPKGTTSWLMHELVKPYKGYVTLESVTFQPVQGDYSEFSAPDFSLNVIYISGESQSTSSIEEYLIKLKNLDVVKSARLVSAQVRRSKLNFKITVLI